MKNTRLILYSLAVALTTLVPSVVGAETIRERELLQQQRIAKGLENGSLTADEAARLEKREAALKTDLSVERKIHDGQADPRCAGVCRQEARYPQQADPRRQAQRSPPVNGAGPGSLRPGAAASRRQTGAEDGFPPG